MSTTDATDADATDATDATDSTERSPARWRSAIAILLTVVAVVLAPLTLTAVWVHDRILSTDGYVETVAPLVDDPVVTDALATRIVDELFAVADVEDRITDVLPGPVDALGRTFTNSLRNLATEQTEKLLASDRFERLWEQANRVAHEQVVAMFSGDGDAVSQGDGKVVLDLGVVADRVRERLVDEGVGILRRVSIPEGAIEVTLFESDLVPELQTAFRVLDDLAAVLPIAFVVVVAGAIGVAPRRRRIVIGLGLGVAAGSALVPVALDLGRRETVDQATSASLNTDATKAVYDALVVALRDFSWLAIAAGLFVALVALVSNPRWIGAVAERLRGTSREVPPVAAWSRAHRMELRFGVLGAALVILVIWPSPTLLVVAVVVLVAAVALALVTALARMRSSVAPGAAGAPDPVDEVG